MFPGRIVAALSLFASTARGQEAPTPPAGTNETAATTDSPEATTTTVGAVSTPAPAGAGSGTMNAAQLAAAITGASAGNWTYAERGPQEWYTGFPECAGRLQSPIELSSGGCVSDTCSVAHQSRPAFLRLFQPRIAPSPLTVRNTGHSLAVDMSGRGITLSSELFWSQYTLDKMEYQMPSGHVIDGKRYPIERIMTFKPSDASALEAAGNTRYAHVMISEVYEMSATEQDPTLQMLIDGGVRADTRSMSVDLNTPLQLSLAGDVYNYPGSLVTPPCSEVVYWNVLAQPKPASAAQLALLQDMVENNMQGVSGRGGSPSPSPRTHIVLKGVARPIQPSNARTVKMRSFFSHDFAE